MAGKIHLATRRDLGGRIRLTGTHGIVSRSKIRSAINRFISFNWRGRMGYFKTRHWLVSFLVRAVLVIIIARRNGGVRTSLTVTTLQVLGFAGGVKGDASTCFTALQALMAHLVQNVVVLAILQLFCTHIALATVSAVIAHDFSAFLAYHP
jgi:hypothetical protein